jgi:hypothetical protein
MHKTNELNHRIKGNMLFTKPHNATKKSHLLVQESQVTYYFIQYSIQCTKSNLKLFFEHPPEQ